MATTDFLPVAAAVGSNVDTQANFAGSSYQLTGFAAGLAQSKQVNKVLRQTSMMTAAWANFCVAQGVSVPDDGNLGNLQAELQSALLAFMAANGIGFTTGDVKPTMKVVADPGWVMLNDGTIGNATSGGTSRANADTVTLFTLIWNNISNTNAPLQDSTGAPVARGANAAADFAANRRISFPKVLGRVFGSAGSGAGLTVRNLADLFGEEKHTQLTSEMAQHNHTANGGLSEFIINAAGPGVAGGAAFLGVFNTDNSGSSAPFNVMQPTTFWNWMVKL